MERIYLFVPPEEYAGVEAAGASWDRESKRWFVPGAPVAAEFSRWLGEDPDDIEFGVTSDRVFVATARMECVRCRREIEVIALYCESGTDEDTGEPIGHATVSNVCAMDAALMAQLASWPSYKRVGGESGDEGFANHCAYCGAAQADYRLHSEPGDIFFDVARAEAGRIELTPLMGRVRFSGDVGFGLEG